MHIAGRSAFALARLEGAANSGAGWRQAKTTYIVIEWVIATGSTRLAEIGHNRSDLVTGTIDSRVSFPHEPGHPRELE
jgi:hypothetical protein